MFFLKLCIFSHIWWKQLSLAVFFILNRSRSASFLRNFQTSLTWPEKPCIVIFASLQPNLTSLSSSLPHYAPVTMVSLPRLCQALPQPRAFAHGVHSACSPSPRLYLDDPSSCKDPSLIHAPCFQIRTQITASFLFTNGR